MLKRKKTKHGKHEKCKISVNNNENCMTHNLQKISKIVIIDTNINTLC